MSVKLVCFDLGGVLVRLCPSLAEACARARVKLPAALAPAVAWPAIMVQARRLNAGELGIVGYGKEVSAALGGQLSPAEVRAIHAVWVLGEYAGVGDLVAEVHALGLDTAILSNTDETHWRPIRDRGIGALVRHGFASHELHVLKPAGEAFAAVEVALRLSPEEILFFDDTAENVAAARARGWQAHAVDRDAETVPQMRAILGETLRLTGGPPAPILGRPPGAREGGDGTQRREPTMENAQTAAARGAPTDLALVLDRLADIESAMARLYEWLAQQFAADGEAVALFAALAREELGHRDLVTFQCQIVRTNRSAFPPVRVDLEAVAALVDEVERFRSAPAAPALAEAISFVLRLECSAAESAYRTVLAGASPALGKLVTRLGTADDRHVGRVRAFAAKRGLV